MAGRPALFLDRDGTLIAEREYLSDPEGVDFLGGVFPALRSVVAAGVEVVIVTNQAGIARGYYTIADYHAVASRVARALEANGVRIAATYFCPHHPDHSGPCACRKPGTGMYTDAARDLGLDFARSYFVGDKASDVLPAVELGGRGILVRTGYGQEHEADVPGEIRVVDDLQAACELIVREIHR